MWALGHGDLCGMLSAEGSGDDVFDVVKAGVLLRNAGDLSIYSKASRALRRLSRIGVVSASVSWVTSGRRSGRQSRLRGKSGRSSSILSKLMS